MRAPHTPHTTHTGVCTPAPWGGPGRRCLMLQGQTGAPEGESTLQGRGCVVQRAARSLCPQLLCTAGTIAPSQGEIATITVPPSVASRLLTPRTGQNSNKREVRAGPPLVRVPSPHGAAPAVPETARGCLRGAHGTPRPAARGAGRGGSTRWPCGWRLGYLHPFPSLLCRRSPTRVRHRPRGPLNTDQGEPQIPEKNMGGQSKVGGKHVKQEKH